MFAVAGPGGSANRVGADRGTPFQEVTISLPVLESANSPAITPSCKFPQIGPDQGPLASSRRRLGKPGVVGRRMKVIRF